MTCFHAGFDCFNQLFNVLIFVAFAYLVHVENDDVQPQLIVAVSGEGDLVPIITAAVALVNAMPDNGLLIDFMAMCDNDELTDKISLFEPFYCCFPVH